MIAADVVYVGPSHAAIFLLAVGGGVAALLVQGVWWRLADWWADWRDQHRDDPLEDAVDDTPDDLPRFVPVVPDRPPTTVVARWWSTGVSLHTADCRYKPDGTDPLPRVYSVDDARHVAQTLNLWLCRMCEPLRVDRDVEEIPQLMTEEATP